MQSLTKDKEEVEDEKVSFSFSSWLEPQKYFCVRCGSESKYLGKIDRQSTLIYCNKCDITFAYRLVN